MKKIIKSGLFLFLVLNACNPLNLIDPIPDPVEGWVFVLQTKKSNSDGALLCTMAPGHSVQPQMGWADVDFVRIYGLTSEIVTISAIAGATATVWVETTLPYWTIDPVKETELAPRVESFSFPIPGGTLHWVISTTNRTATLTCVHRLGGTDTALFSLCVDVINHVPTGISLPHFSGNIVIKRLHSDFDGTFIFYVKAPSVYSHTPVYTGFRVRFE